MSFFQEFSGRGLPAVPFPVQLNLTGVSIMSKSNKNKHYALSQMRELRKDFIEMRDKWEKDPQAVMQQIGRAHV